MEVKNEGSLIKVKSGFKTTATTDKKKKSYVPITIYTSEERSYSVYGCNTTTGGGIKNEWNNTDFSVGTDRMSYSKSFELLLDETSKTYSITNDGDVEYEASGSICWDNTEFTVYISMSSKWQIVAAAAAFAVGKNAAIPVIVPVLAGAK